MTGSPPAAPELDDNVHSSHRSTGAIVWGLVAASVWIGRGLHETSVRMVSNERRGAIPIRVSPATATLPEWTLLPGVGEALAARLDEHRMAASPTAWRGVDGWRLDRVRGVGPVLQADVAADLDRLGVGEDDR